MSAGPKHVKCTFVSQGGMMKRREDLPPGKIHDHATARHEPAAQPVRQANKTRAPMPYFREAHTTPHNRIGTDQVTLQLEFGAAIDCLSDPVHRSILPQTPPLVSGSARCLRGWAAGLPLAEPRGAAPQPSPPSRWKCPSDHSNRCTIRHFRT